MRTTVLTAELRAGSVARTAGVQTILAAAPQQETNRGRNHPGRSRQYSDNWQPGRSGTYISRGPSAVSSVTAITAAGKVNRRKLEDPSR
jgi:hypothetical protein